MKKLIVYILGIFTVISIIPIFESLTELISAWIEVLKCKPMEIVLKENNKIADLQAKLEPVSTQAIGFITNSKIEGVS